MQNKQNDSNSTYGPFVFCCTILCIWPVIGIILIVLGFTLGIPALKYNGIAFLILFFVLVGFLYVCVSAAVGEPRKIHYIILFICTSLVFITGNIYIVIGAIGPSSELELLLSDGIFLFILSCVLFFSACRWAYLKLRT